MLGPEFAVAAVAAVFGAGVAWGLMRGTVSRTRKDLNGVGRKVRRIEIAMLLAAPEDKREEMMARFWPE